MRVFASIVCPSNMLCLQDDEITKHVASALEADMAQVKEDEHRRNTARLSEVMMLRHRNEAQLAEFRAKK